MDLPGSMAAGFLLILCFFFYCLSSTYDSGACFPWFFLIYLPIFFKASLWASVNVFPCIISLRMWRMCSGVWCGACLFSASSCLFVSVRI